MNIETDEKTVRQFARVIFNRAFTLGWFVGGDPKKMAEAYSMMCNDLKDTLVTDEIKKLIEALNK